MTNTIEYGDISYKSIRDLCKRNNLSYSTIISRMRCGYSLSDAIEGNLKMNEIKRTHSQFVEEVKILTHNTYEVLSEYTSSRGKVKVKHIECGYTYDIKATVFLQGGRCSKCATNARKTHAKYIEEVYLLVKDEYTVLGKYTLARNKIKIKHNSCNFEYDVVASKFLFDDRCPNCCSTKKKTAREVRNKIVELGNNEYELLGEYKNSVTPIKLKHIACSHIFKMTYGNFVSQGQRCPKCKSSKGERLVSNFLNRQNLRYEEQYKFKECINIRPLPFDFAVLGKNENVIALMEFDGRQHFEPVDFFGGEEGLSRIKLHDRIKNNFCEDNNIPLLRIPYWEQGNIEAIISNFLNIESGITIVS